MTSLPLPLISLANFDDVLAICRFNDGETFGKPPVINDVGAVSKGNEAFIECGGATEGDFTSF